MKRLLPLVLSALLSAAASGSAIAAQNGPPRPGSSELARFVDVVGPEARGREFTLFRADIGPSLEIGCDGELGFKFFERIGNELVELWDQLSNGQLLLGLAINYLIFSNPTLYQIYENINLHREFLRKLMVFSCTSVRQMASEDRKNKLLSIAKSKCLEDGAVNPEKCDQAETLKDYLPQAGTALDRQLARLQGSVNDFDLGKWLKDTLGLGVPPDPNIVGSIDGISANPAAVAAQNRVKDLMFTVNTGADPESGLIEFKKPNKTVSKVMEESVAYYRGLLDTISGVADDLGDSSSQLGADTLNVTKKDAWKILQTDPAFGRVSNGTIAHLIDIRRKKTGVYDEAAEALAIEMGLAATRHAVATLTQAMKMVQSGEPGANLYSVAPAIYNAISVEIDRMQAELAMEEGRAENIRRIGEASSSVLQVGR